MEFNHEHMPVYIGHANKVAKLAASKLKKYLHQTLTNCAEKQQRGELGPGYDPNDVIQEAMKEFFEITLLHMQGQDDALDQFKDLLDLNDDQD
jgi:hypothetical protein